MSQPPAPGPHGHLPRLIPEFYRGQACVHWVMTVQERASGWLHEQFHAPWRETMLHSLARHDLVCPVYCLMPDHAHFIWLGTSDRSDQRKAVAFFRRTTNPLLAPHRWQREAYDHVLRENERKRGAFSAACQYVLENPVRKNLVTERADYPFSGALVPGYPDLDPRRGDFWEVFWKVYQRMIASPAPSRLPDPCAPPVAAALRDAAHIAHGVPPLLRSRGPSYVAAALRDAARPRAATPAAAPARPAS